jgi:hypothetical protein
LNAINLSLPVITLGFKHFDYRMLSKSLESTMRQIGDK